MIPIENAWRDDFDRPPDIPSADGGTWKNKDGSCTSMVQLTKSHWWNNGWIPTDLRLQKMPDGRFIRPDLGVVFKDGMLNRGTDRYQPLSMGWIDKGRPYLRHAPSFTYAEDNKFIWQIGPYQWMSEFSGEGWRDLLILPEKPDLSGSHLYVEFYSNVGMNKEPFAMDARGDVLPLQWSQIDQNFLVMVPNEWLEQATYPVEIDPEKQMVSGCRTGGNEYGSYANAGTMTKWWCDYSPASAWVGQDVVGNYYRRWRGQYCFKLQQFCCWEILSAYFKESAFGFSCDFSVQDFDIEIQKYDWSAYELYAVCDDQCDDSGGPDSAVCNSIHANQPAAAVDVVFRNTSGIVCDTYYNSPALDVNWIENQHGGCGGCVYYGLISGRDRTDTMPASSTPEYIVMATRSGSRPATLVFTWYPCGPQPELV